MNAIKLIQCIKACLDSKLWKETKSTNLVIATREDWFQHLVRWFNSKLMSTSGIHGNGPSFFSLYDFENCFSGCKLWKVRLLPHRMSNLEKNYFRVQNSFCALHLANRATCRSFYQTKFSLLRLLIAIDVRWHAELATLNKLRWPAMKWIAKRIAEWIAEWIADGPRHTFNVLYGG